MPPRTALRLPRRLLTTAARLGRVMPTPNSHKRLAQQPEEERIDPSTATSSSTGTSSSPAAVAPPVNVASGIVGATIPPSPRRRSRTVAKETLLLGLQGLAASADAFPPLKSAVGGLLFFVDQVELASDNKTEILNIYAHIDTIGSSLVQAIPDGSELSRAHEAALRAFASEIQVLCTNLEGIAHGRKHPVKRFICAKRHRAQLEDIVRRLNNADASFMDYDF